MNSFGHVCSHCGEVDKIKRPVALFCTACKARPGELCVDMRTVANTRKPVKYFHPERQGKLLEVDADRPGVHPVALQAVAG